MKNKLLLVAGLNLLFTFNAFAQTTYWEVTKINKVMTTSIVFEMLISELTEMDFFEYDADKDEMLYHSGYKSTVQPIDLDEEDGWVIEKKIQNGQVKIAIHDGRKDLVFITCQQIKGSREDFLKRVAANKDLIKEEKLKAAQAHPKIELPDTKNSDLQMVRFEEGFTLMLPLDSFFVMEGTNAYAFIHRHNQDKIQSKIHVALQSYNLNDSLENSGWYALAQKDQMRLNTYAYYDAKKKEGGTRAYNLTNSLQVGDQFVNLRIQYSDKLESTYPFLPIVQSLDLAQTKDVLYIDGYNAGRVKPIKTKKVKVDANLQIEVPENYTTKIWDSHDSGFYEFIVNEKLHFQSSDERCSQLEITEPTSAEKDVFDVIDGGVYTLKDASLNIELDSLKQGYNEEWNTLMGSDETGFYYINRDDYCLMRYLKKNGVHYVYSLKFNTLDECIDEFVRSKEWWEKQ